MNFSTRGGALYPANPARARSSWRLRPWWQAQPLRVTVVSACACAMDTGLQGPEAAPPDMRMSHPLQGAAQLAPGASLASVNLRITIGSGVPVPVPWTVVLQNPNYVGRVQQARSTISHARCVSLHSVVSVAVSFPAMAHEALAKCATLLHIILSSWS